MTANSNAIQCRGIRGAITVDENTEPAMLEATRELLAQLFSANAVAAEDLAAIFFTATPDLNAAFPAKAARQMGYVQVPLMGSQEMDVPEAPGRCIRVLMLVNTARRLDELVHVYLRGAVVLRPEYQAEGKP
ncbi:MAG TPA: chorismate mutase [Myxococcaceae bacterium]|nr:chorismate mutase [Myxococcaceae bacterium]